MAIYILYIMHFEKSYRKVVHYLSVECIWKSIEENASEAGNMFTTFETLTQAVVFDINLLEFSQLLNHTLIHPISSTENVSSLLSYTPELKEQTNKKIEETTTTTKITHTHKMFNGKMAIFVQTQYPTVLQHSLSFSVCAVCIFLHQFTSFIDQKSNRSIHQMWMLINSNVFVLKRHWREWENGFYPLRIISVITFVSIDNSEKFSNTNIV